MFLANKLIQQIPDLKNAYQPKTFRNPKSSNKLYKTIKQAEKVSSDSSLYSDKKKSKYFKWQKYKTIKTTTCFNFNIRALMILKLYFFFHPKLQVKDTECAIESNLIWLLTWLKGFKFVTTLVLVRR